MTHSESDDHPHVIALPPFMLLAAVLVGAVLEWLVPMRQPFPTGSWMIGLALILLALAIASAARRVQTRAGTNVNPTRPTTAIVTAGPYGFSRNPMYVGLALFHLGIAVWAHSGWLLVTFVPFVALLHWGVVLREERYLAARFGQPYLDYRSRVRRYV